MAAKNRIELELEHAVQARDHRLQVLVLAHMPDLLRDEQVPGEQPTAFDVEIAGHVSGMPGRRDGPKCLSIGDGDLARNRQSAYLCRFSPDQLLIWPQAEPVGERFERFRRRVDFRREQFSDGRQVAAMILMVMRDEYVPNLSFFEETTHGTPLIRGAGVDHRRSQPIDDACGVDPRAVSTDADTFDIVMGNLLDHGYPRRFDIRERVSSISALFTESSRTLSRLRITETLKRIRFVIGPFMREPNNVTPVPYPTHSTSAHSVGATARHLPVSHRSVGSTGWVKVKGSSLGITQRGRTYLLCDDESAPFVFSASGRSRESSSAAVRCPSPARYSGLEANAMNASTLD